MLCALCRQPLSNVMHMNLNKHSSRAGGLQCFMHSCKYMTPLSLTHSVGEVHGPVTCRRARLITTGGHIL